MTAQDNTDTGLREALISLAEAAKLAGFNAKELSYDGREHGFSNQMEGYYDTVSVVKDLEALVARQVQAAQIAILKKLEHKQAPATYSEDYSPLFNQGFHTMRSKVSFERQRLEKLQAAAPSTAEGK